MEYNNQIVCTVYKRTVRNGMLHGSILILISKLIHEIMHAAHRLLHCVDECLCSWVAVIVEIDVERKVEGNLYHLLGHFYKSGGVEMNKYQLHIKIGYTKLWFESHVTIFTIGIRTAHPQTSSLKKNGLHNKDFC